MSRNLRIGSKFKFNIRWSVWLNGALALAIVSTGCDKNYLASFVTNPNDESRLYSAQNNIRSGSYDSAISDCSGISGSSLSQERFATICASAYAGRCGYSMNFILANVPYTTPAPPAAPPWAPWGHFMITKLGATATTAIADCNQAETILRGLGAPAARSADANVFMLTLSLYKLGVIAKALGDTDNNQILDPAFDACNISIAPTNYKQITAEAVWDLLQSATQLKSDALLGTAATAIASQCTVLSLIGEDICGATDPTALTASQTSGGLSTLKEGFAFGVNQCNNGASAATCNCP